MEAEEYNQFFKATFREFMDPLATAHFNVEGTIEFSALLFVPGMAPFEQQARTPLPAAQPLRGPVAVMSRRECSRISGMVLAVLETR